jgi:ADP-heptose:LPS heptosyltransferase
MTRQYKIGILRALYLGDLLCIIPTVRAIRKAYPLASITLIGLPWQRNFVERFQQYFDAFVEFPGWPGLPEQPVEPKRVVEFLLNMQAEKFDLVIQMQGNGVITNTLCMLFAAKKVCGLRRRHEYCPDEKLFPISEDTDHEVLRFLKLVDALEILPQGHELEFSFFPEGLIKAEKLLKQWTLSSQQYICVHPGARDFRRRWPASSFAFVADKLAAEGFKIVLTGSEEENEILHQVAKAMKYPSINTVSESGHLELGVLASLIKNCAALLSNDTGVSHIASALQVPSVIIFSAFSNPERWAPLNPHTKVIPVEMANDCQLVFDAMLDVIDMKQAIDNQH